MRSKEEILEGMDHDMEQLDYEQTLLAMSEYAKQEAIAFSLWKDDNVLGSRGTYSFYLKSPFFEGDKYYTLEQLYELYLQSKM